MHEHFDGNKTYQYSSDFIYLTSSFETDIEDVFLGRKMFNELVSL
ncbi:MAG TPA: hypothetical protein VG895_04395 [Patescibacteria group bacterium]|nr:hypothetical protein [Patescibacteria group bacterium]